MYTQQSCIRRFARLSGSTSHKESSQLRRVPPYDKRHGVRLDAHIEDVSQDEIIENEQVTRNPPSFAGSLLMTRVKDFYDIEPNKVHERNALPRKMRYYHGLIDTKLLETGTNYEKLPNVFIIMILPYDPFDKKRMVYTIKNQCVEDTTVFYEDGAIKTFLYTKGTQGNPSQNLIDMLKYIEKSTEENVVNQDIAAIHHMVKHIKQNRDSAQKPRWQYKTLPIDTWGHQKPLAK